MRCLALSRCLGRVAMAPAVFAETWITTLAVLRSAGLIKLAAVYSNQPTMPAQLAASSPRVCIRTMTTAHTTPMLAITSSMSILAVSPLLTSLALFFKALSVCAVVGSHSSSPGGLVAFPVLEPKVLLPRPSPVVRSPAQGASGAKMAGCLRGCVNAEASQASSKASGFCF